MISEVYTLEKSPANSKRLRKMLVFTLGFILSPLSWWNDAVVNIPISYLLSLPFSLIDERLYLPAFIAIYWLTNVVGLVMMHMGARGLLNQAVKHPLRNSLFISLAYTLLIVVLVLSGLLSAPTGN